MDTTPFTNPFKPGAGHTPPYMAGRTEEIKEFSDLLKQKVILENMVLTGLRGVGKTVLLEKFKPIAIKIIGYGWELISPSQPQLQRRLLQFAY